MTTITNKLLHAKKFSVRDFASFVTESLGDSIGDMIITVAVTGITLAYMTQIIPQVYVDFVPGLYIGGMLVQLFIRIVHRFDEHYTIDEVGEQLQRLEDHLDKRLDDFFANYIP